MTIIGIITAALNYEKPPAKDDFSAETERNTTAPRFDVKVVGNSYADPTSRRVTFTVTNLTQEELAVKAGTKKSYISKIENAKGNIQLSTLIRIFEKGLNRKIGLTFL